MNAGEEELSGGVIGRELLRGTPRKEQRGLSYRLRRLDEHAQTAYRAWLFLGVKS
jgi:hypothetical protein